VSSLLRQGEKKGENLKIVLGEEAFLLWGKNGNNQRGGVRMSNVWGGGKGGVITIY